MLALAAKGLLCWAHGGPARGRQKLEIEKRRRLLHGQRPSACSSGRRSAGFDRWRSPAGPPNSGFRANTPFIVQGRGRPWKVQSQCRGRLAPSLGLVEDTQDPCVNVPAKTLGVLAAHDRLPLLVQRRCVRQAQQEASSRSIHYKTPRLGPRLGPRFGFGPSPGEALVAKALAQGITKAAPGHPLVMPRWPWWRLGRALVAPW